MKQILILFGLIFILHPTFGQKRLDIPKTRVVESFIKTLPKKIRELDLKDLRTSTDSLNIRIWQTHEVFTINYNNATFSNYKIYTTNEKLVFKTFKISEQISKNIMDSLLVSRVMNLENEDYRGVDGGFVFIEISTKNSYKIVSFWSPSSERSDNCKTVVQILGMLDKTVDTGNLKSEFLNSLSSGSYRWGMTSIRIDRFLDKDVSKTDFYYRAGKRMRRELNITDKTDHWNFPLILVDKKTAKISDLNKYTNKQIAKFEILKPNNNSTAIYGYNGSNGVVLIELK
ncbi:hypothetical protein JoomaDRAFT_0163 [Galbibacter orientalis DSM 19592]|uniref:Uncharacterized protein n=1 Tax=Galbibacter orientalis DSM 19592 TaxID=926559 RepID=I3C0T0_9FLAO|nr:hypothetical protein [Galbibacter orientalis]EIJ37223.1 hypothetical protein JoomaDRAFT_0163 [Galbibacter orientalis DSM 19592]